MKILLFFKNILISLIFYITPYDNFIFSHQCTQPATACNDEHHAHHHFPDSQLDQHRAHTHTHTHTHTHDHSHSKHPNIEKNINDNNKQNSPLTKQPPARPNKKESFTQKKETPFNYRKGVYMTSWVAGTKKGLSLLDQVKESGLDTVVIDMKDASGYLTYDSTHPLVNQWGFKEIRITNDRLKYILNFCRKNNIRTIARIVISKDPLLSTVYNHKYAIHTSSKHNPTIWVDLFSKEVRDYNIAIAKEISKLGFDEINFDYIRFPDRKEVKQPQLLSRQKFHHTKEKKLYQAIELFLKQADKHIHIPLSVDVYAFTLWGSKERHLNENINHIGQVIESMANHVDYIYPMVYPSHFSKHDQELMDKKHKGPVEYGVVYEACQNGLRRIANKRAKLIPWIQGFWGDETYIINELDAVIDSGIDGFLIWNAKSKYEPFWKTFRAYKNKL